MRPALTVVVALLVATAAVVAVPSAALAPDPPGEPTDASPETAAAADGPATSGATAAASTGADNHSNDSNLSAGQQLSAVVGVGEAEVEGDVEERSFGLRMGNASTDEERAAVVGEKTEDLREDLNEVRDRMDDLRQARENGSIGESEYRAKVTPLAARATALERQVDATAAASEGLPADLLEENGVNASAIQELKTDAGNLSGGEVADIARGIGGPGTGSPVSAGPPGEIPGNGTPGADGDDRDGAGGDTDADAGTDAGADGADDADDATERVDRARDLVAAA